MWSATQKRLRWTFADKTKSEVLGWNAHYTTYDLALLKIETDKKLTALPVASVLPRKGDKTIAIGAPQGLSFTASEGIVSGIREGSELKQFGTNLSGTWLQTSTTDLSREQWRTIVELQWRSGRSKQFIAGRVPKLELRDFLRTDQSISRCWKKDSLAKT